MLLVGWLCWGFTSLSRYFSHIATWKQGITNLWNRSGETGNGTPYSCSASEELNHYTTAVPLTCVVKVYLLRMFYLWHKNMQKPTTCILQILIILHSHYSKRPSPDSQGRGGGFEWSGRYEQTWERTLATYFLSNFRKKIQWEVLKKKLNQLGPSHMYAATALRSLRVQNFLPIAEVVTRFQSSRRQVLDLTAIKSVAACKACSTMQSIKIHYHNDW